MMIQKRQRATAAMAGLFLGMAFCLSVPAQAANSAPQTAVGFDFDAKSVNKFIQQQKSAVTGPYRLNPGELRKRDFLYGFVNMFRVMAATNPQRLRQQYAPKQKAVLAEMLETRAYRDAPGIWPYFFRSSLIYVGLLKSPVVRVGFYNPIVDGWVITDWAWRGRKIKLAMVRVMAGEEVRGEDVRAAKQTPRFVTRKGSLIGNLRNSVGLAGITFAKAWPMLGVKPPAARRIADAGYSRAVVDGRLVGAGGHVCAR